MRNEFPNPMERRERWQPLNGKWLFSFDKPIYDREIEVPFAYQTEASGVNEKEHHETVWYKRDVILNDEMKSSERVVVRFLAVDYEATVFVNGRFACFHAGGYEAFSVDITDLITREKETIEVKVADPLDADRPRGKQDWNENPSRCWYYQTTGIWQSVWLEGYGSDYIRSFGITPDAEKTDVRFDVSLASGEAETIVVDIESQFFDKPLTYTASVARKRKVVLVANLPKPDLVYDKHLWSPAAPNLYRATIKTITYGRISDEVKTHFAFRTVEARNGKILLNGVPFEPKMVLDQGYWRSGGMTAPSARSFEEDILAAKAMGFNAARKHQKVEDPYFYYYADVHGFPVWAETPSAYEFGKHEIATVIATQLALIDKVYNHPSVIAYVPFNESWGILEVAKNKQEQSFVRAVTELIRARDGGKIVIGNDGWETLDCSDIITVHDYSSFGDDFAEKYTEPNESDTPVGRRITVEGGVIGDKPVMLSEFGGISLSEKAGWGYGEDVGDEKEYINRLERLIDNYKKTRLWGWCFTQLTDVEQETNGLLDSDHKPKFDVEKIKKAISK